MEAHDIFKFVIVTCVVLVPVLATTLALFARVALKPITQAIIELREVFNDRDRSLREREVHVLQERLEELERELTLVKEQSGFDRALKKPD